MRKDPLELNLIANDKFVSGLRFGECTNPDELAIALHGWLDNAAGFFGLAQNLENLDLLAIDLPGHGRSDHLPASVTYSFHQWVIELYYIHKALGHHPTGIVAHSMGAAIAMMYAATYPELVKWLVCIDGGVPLYDDPASGPERLRSHIDSRDALRNAAKPMATIEMANQVRAAAGTFDQAENLKPMVTRNLRKSKSGYLWRTDRSLRSPSSFRMSRDQVGAYLKKVTCPVLAIQADPGMTAFSPLIAQAMADIPTLTHKVLPGHHHIHLDHPDIVAKEIDQWLEF